MFADLIGLINDFMYGKLLIIMLLGVGLYFSVITKFIQFRLLKETLKIVFEKPDKNGNVSSFHALMVSTASRVGTGNIIGVSTAICLGGYGSLFWMWMIAIIGGASAFVESTLAQIYKKRDKNNGSYGGPSYYIEVALHNRALAVVFAISLILTYALGFNMLASYNLQSTFSGYSFYGDWTPWIIGGILSILVLFCLLGGGARIIKVTSALVPIMGTFYIILALIVIFMNLSLFPSVLARIFRDAFDFTSIFGGFAGSCVMYGIKRGLYSNEAGIGSAPNAAASAQVSHPVKQGLVQMLSVFIDTLIICTATAFMCLFSGVEPAKELAGAPYVQGAMIASFGDIGPIFITLAMVFFAFTTILGNLYYVDNCLIYILKRVPNKTFMNLYRIIASIIVFIGAGMEIGMVWNIADVLMGVMAIINLPVICLLSKTAILSLNDYIKQRKSGKNPEFLAKDINLKDKTDFWN